MENKSVVVRGQERGKGRREVGMAIKGPHDGSL